MQYRLFIILLLSLFLGQQLQGQNIKIKAINNYVQFANESTHGMLIISRLLENFNKKVNKYVETQDKELSSYSNGDLPKDIFLDPEKWFYEISPTSWYAIAVKESNALNKDDADQMNLIVKEMKKITHDANLFRFKLEEYVNFMNYKDPVFLEKLYVMLEESIVFFDKFYEQQLALESLVNKQKQSIEKPKHLTFFKAYDDIYIPLRKSLKDLRTKNNSNLLSNVQDYKTSLNSFNSIAGDNYFSNSKSVRKLKFLKQKAKAVLSTLENFLNNVPVPDDYKFYGKYYFYHNADILNKTNKYGNGLISEVNKIITKENEQKVMYFEVPHFYKVVKKKITWKKRDYKKRKKRK